MNLFYAMGGGMGHVYRTWVFIQHFQITEYKILSSNPAVRKFFREDEIIFLNPEQYEQSWAQFAHHVFPTLPVSTFYIDTFPAGIIGELSQLTVKIPMYYIARRMRWQNYALLTIGFKHSFSKVYQLEPLESKHATFIHAHSTQLQPLCLMYPTAEVKNIPAEVIPSHQPLWVIVHAFNLEEVETLLLYAKDVATITQTNPYFVVLSDQSIQIPGTTCLEYFPAVDWFPLVEKIFIGAGFNSVQQTRPYLDKVMFFPFPRKYDDQAWRVNYMKRLSHINPIESI